MSDMDWDRAFNFRFELRRTGFIMLYYDMKGREINSDGVYQYYIYLYLYATKNKVYYLSDNENEFMIQGGARHFINIENHKLTKED
jgi:hypothetical protein